MSNEHILILTLVISLPLGALTLYLLRNKTSRVWAQVISGTVVLGVVFGIRAMVSPSVDTAELEAQLAKFTLEENPAFFAAKEFDKPAYDGMIAELKLAIEKGQNYKATSIGEKLSTSMLKKYLPLATDIAIIEYLKRLNGIYLVMGQRDLKNCVRYVHPQIYGAPTRVPIEFLDKEGRTRFSASVYNLIKSATTEKPTLPSAYEANEALKKLFAEFNTRKPESAKLLMNPGESLKAQKEKELCQGFVDFNDLVINGKADHIKAIRAFYSQW